MRNISARAEALADVIAKGMKEFGLNELGAHYSGEYNAVAREIADTFFRQVPEELQAKSAPALLCDILEKLVLRGEWITHKGVITLYQRLEEALRPRPAASPRKLAKQMAAVFCDVLFEPAPGIREQNEADTYSRFDDIVDEVGNQGPEAILREAHYLLGMVAERHWISASITAEMRQQLDERLRAVYYGTA